MGRPDELPPRDSCQSYLAPTGWKSWLFPLDHKRVALLYLVSIVMSGAGYLLSLSYLLWSLRHGAKAGPNPWRATTLEWQTPSPPPTDNFESTPAVF